jgi:hypothetical protein
VHATKTSLNAVYNVPGESCCRLLVFDKNHNPRRRGLLRIKLSRHLHVCFEIWHIACANLGRSWSIQQSTQTLLIKLEHEYAVSDIKVCLDVAKSSAPDPCDLATVLSKIMAGNSHPSKPVSVIMKSKFFEARQCSHNFHKIVLSTRMHPLQTSAHSSPLQLVPRIPWARCNAVVNCLKNARANRQIHFLALVAAINVNGQTPHVTRHVRSAAHTAVHVHHALGIQKAVRWRMPPTKITQVKHGRIATGGTFAGSRFVH